MSGEAKVHLRFKTSSFHHLQGATAAGKRNESSLLHEAAPSWHLLTSQFHLFCVGREKPVGGCPFSRRDQGMGQVSQQGSWLTDTAECWGLELGNIPESIISSSDMAAALLSTQRWGSCSPWTAGKGQAAMNEALTKYCVVQTDLPFFRQLLKMKIPSRSLFTANLYLLG